MCTVVGDTFGAMEWLNHGLEIPLTYRRGAMSLFPSLTVGCPDHYPLIYLLSKTVGLSIPSMTLDLLVHSMRLRIVLSHDLRSFDKIKTALLTCGRLLLLSLFMLLKRFLSVFVVNVAKKLSLQKTKLAVLVAGKINLAVTGYPLSLAKGEIC